MRAFLSYLACVLGLHGGVQTYDHSTGYHGCSCGRRWRMR